MRNILLIIIPILLGILTFLSMIDGEVSRDFATPMTVLVMMVASSHSLLRKILDELQR